jgi:hypothetical protein
MIRQAHLPVLYIDAFPSVDNPHNKPCLATLVFSNEDFLPVTFDLPPPVLTCIGSQQARITVPSQIPNGDASILW